jgi:hypothetical protein
LNPLWLGCKPDRGFELGNRSFGLPALERYETKDLMCLRLHLTFLKVPAFKADFVR